MCRYYSEYSYCKFGEYCKFKHQEIIETKENEIKNKDMEIRNNEALELENRELKETIEELKLEVETLRNDKAVEFILFEDFKECMKQAGAELGQAQLKLGLDPTLTNLH